MMLAEHGKLKILEEKMAVYRFGVGLHSTNSMLKKVNPTLNYLHYCCLTQITNLLILFF